MQKVVNNILVIIGIAESIWSGYKWILEVEIVIGVFSIGPAEWLALSVAGGLTALIAGFHILKKLLFWNRYRFGELAGEIHSHRIDTETQIAKRIHQTELLEKRKSLMFSLEAIGIETPELEADADRWTTFLTNLRPLAMHRRIKEARQLMNRIRSEQ